MHLLPRGVTLFRTLVYDYNLFNKMLHFRSRFHSRQSFPAVSTTSTTSITAVRAGLHVCNPNRIIRERTSKSLWTNCCVHQTLDGRQRWDNNPFEGLVRWDCCFQFTLINIFCLHSFQKNLSRQLISMSFVYIKSLIKTMPILAIHSLLLGDCIWICTLDFNHSLLLFTTQLVANSS